MVNLTDAEIRSLDESIMLLSSLVNDLKLIRSGRGPSPDLLAHAPIMQNWCLARRLETCLAGNFKNHPLIADLHYGVTSQLWFIDPHGRFVRTLSRFYRLGEPLEGAGQNLQ